MVNARRAVQEAHESFTVGLLVEALNHRHRGNYLASPGPNPPDALLRSGRRTTWVEVTTAYLSRDFARDLNSFATQGEEHHDTSGQLLIDPDRTFAENFCDVVQEKLEKSTYQAAHDLYGPGYLVVSIQNPFFGRGDIPKLGRAWSQRSVVDTGCFRSIYLTYRVFRGYHVSLWRHWRRDLP